MKFSRQKRKGTLYIDADGASLNTGIKNEEGSTREELFPDAEQILDYFHLCENVNTSHMQGTYSGQNLPCGAFVKQKIG